MDPDLGKQTTQTPAPPLAQNSPSSMQNVSTQTSPDSKNNTWIFLIIIAAGVIAILVMLFYFSPQKKSETASKSLQTQNPVPTVSLSDLSNVPIIKWPTYSVHEIGMTIKYNPDWKIGENFAAQYKLNNINFYPNSGIGVVRISWDAQIYPLTCTGGKLEKINFAGETIDACHSVSQNVNREWWDFKYSYNDIFGITGSFVACLQYCTPQDIQAKQISNQILANIKFDKKLFDLSTWNSIAGEIYTISYPSSWAISKDASNPTSMQIYDPTSKNIWFNLGQSYVNGSSLFVTISTTVSPQSPWDYVNAITANPPYTKENSEIQRNTLNNYAGASYKPYDLKENKYMYVLTNGKNLIFVETPESATHNLITKQIVSTFKLLN